MRRSFSGLSLTVGVVLLVGIVSTAFSDGPLASLVGHQKSGSNSAAGTLELDKQNLDTSASDSDSEMIAGGDPTSEIQQRMADQNPATANREPKQGTDIQSPPAINNPELQPELEEYLRSRSGVYGVALWNEDTGQTVLVNADLPFLSASTYKVLVMYRVYQQMDRGMLNANQLLTITQRDAVEDDPEGGLYPGETVAVADALEAMITVSSNAAAYALTRLVGGWDSIDAAAQELGMSQTGQGVDHFYTTPADMLTFFEALAKGQLVSANASQSMLALLERQKVNDRIPALLPAGTIVAHKTGELPGVRNDVGIVYGPEGRYVICEFSQQADEDVATEVLAQVSLRIYERYDQ